MSNYNVTIRLLEGEFAFVYTIEQNGDVVDSAIVQIDEQVYYGGSEAID